MCEGHVRKGETRVISKPASGAWKVSPVENTPATVTSVPKWPAPNQKIPLLWLPLAAAVRPTKRSRCRAPERPVRAASIRLVHSVSCPQLRNKLAFSHTRENRVSTVSPAFVVLQRQVCHGGSVNAASGTSLRCCDQCTSGISSVTSPGRSESADWRTTHSRVQSSVQLLPNFAPATLLLSSREAGKKHWVPGDLSPLSCRKSVVALDTWHRALPWWNSVIELAVGRLMLKKGL